MSVGIKGADLRRPVAERRDTPVPEQESTVRRCRADRDSRGRSEGADPDAHERERPGDERQNGRAVERPPTRRPHDLATELRVARNCAHDWAERLREQARPRRFRGVYTVVRDCVASQPTSRSAPTPAAAAS